MPLAVEVETRGRMRCGSGAREYRRALLVALEGARPVLATGPGPERPRCLPVPGPVPGSERAPVIGLAAPTATAAAALSLAGTPTKAAPTSASASPEKNSEYFIWRFATRRIARISARRRARLARFRSLHMRTLSIEQMSTHELYNCIKYSYGWLEHSRLCEQIDSTHPSVMLPLSLGSSRCSMSSACAVEISTRNVFYHVQKTRSCSESSE